jgi:hypothetical protein
MMRLCQQSSHILARIVKVSIVHRRLNGFTHSPEHQKSGTSWRIFDTPWVTVIV